MASKTSTPKKGHALKKESVLYKLLKDIRQNRWIYVMLIPVIAYFIIFQYIPMYGAVIAFKNFSPGKGIIRSDWAQPLLMHFQDFFSSPYAGRVIRNTLVINITALAFGFPAPIIFALLLNELRGKAFKRVAQTISYLPYFISMMVVCSMILDFFSSRGFITQILNTFFGAPLENMLMKANNFVPIYVSTNIWQNMGWNSIIYLSALTNVGEELYEAAHLDGAGRLMQTLHVTLPGIMPTIIIMLILRIGNMMSIGFEKIILLYNPQIYETADVISSFVYRMGIYNANYSYGAAVGLFNSVINFTLLILANNISRKVSDSALW